MKNIGAHVILLLVIAALTCGCATSSKIQAAAFLRQCKIEVADVEIRNISLDSAAVLIVIQQLLSGQLDRPVGHATLAVRLRVDSRNEDTLLVDKLEGEISLDTLVRSPVKLVGTALLRPGISEATLEAVVPLDTNLLKLPSAQNYRLQGAGSGTLQAKRRHIELEFDEQGPLPEKIKKKLKSANKLVMDEVLSGWIK
jgi:hypothetical protein